MRPQVNQRRIDIAEIGAGKLPNYKETYESKDSVIAKYIINWVKNSFESKKIKPNDFFPQKDKLASLFNVSVGTVQSAIRYVEDEGYLVSKQRVGTMIASVDNPISDVRKLTSKRDKIIFQVKKLILDKKIKVDQTLPSARKLSEILGVSANTIRLAYEFLRNLGIIESRFTRGNDANWILKKIPELDDMEFASDTITSDTLVSKVTEDLKNYIQNNLKVSDRLPAHAELANVLNVSIKTVHDAMKPLIIDGTLLVRRGRYGTVIQKLPNSPNLEPKKETSIFANAEDAAFYSYQKVENHILTTIVKEYELGDKLPSMEQLAKSLDVSTNTVRKALKNLSNRGIVQFGRGRYGGTFITDIPEDYERQTFKWLSVNPEYVKAYSN